MVTLSSAQANPALQWATLALTALYVSAIAEPTQAIAMDVICVDHEHFLIYRSPESASFLYVSSRLPHVACARTPEGDVIADATGTATRTDLDELEYFHRSGPVPLSTMAPKKRLLLRRSGPSQLMLEAFTANALSDDAENWVDVCSLLIHLYQRRRIPTVTYSVAIPELDVHFLAVPGRGAFGGLWIGSRWTSP